MILPWIKGYRECEIIKNVTYNISLVIYRMWLSLLCCCTVSHWSFVFAKLILIIHSNNSRNNTFYESLICAMNSIARKCNCLGGLGLWPDLWFISRLVAINLWSYSFGILVYPFLVYWTNFCPKTVSANLKVVHIGPKHVHIGHVLVQTTPKMG